MWIMLSDAFLSIVTAGPGLYDQLLVRARVKNDIERIFPRAKVLYTPGGDYHYRANVDRQTVVNKLTVEIVNIDYENFKNSVVEKDRHDAYLRCWVAMADFQAGRAPQKKARRRAKKK